MTRKSKPTADQPQGKVGNDVVFVLGAGVDRSLGLPLVNTLFRELSDFVEGSGKSINKAVRKHVKHLRFDLRTFDGDQSENLGQKLLGSHAHLLPLIERALNKHPDTANLNVRAVRTVIQKLSKIADENELDEAMVSHLSRLAGQVDTGVADTLLDPERIAFRPTVRQAVKALFTSVATEIPGLNQDEQEAFAEVVAILSNFEELMASLFTGYYTKHITNQKKYFYLAWILWTYIRHREDVGRRLRAQSFYHTLSEVGPGGGVITFNYTDFFCDRTRPDDGYFHGDCKAYIRLDTRDYVANDIQLRNATTLDRMETFIDGLQIDWTTDPPKVAVPSFVPPLALKPIICSEYLDRWYRCSQTIKAANTILIVGYSFNVADEHFNDLIRKGNRNARLIIVDPNSEAVINRVCQTLTIDHATLRPLTAAGLQCFAGGRLVFVKEKAEKVSPSHITTLLASEQRR